MSKLAEAGIPTQMERLLSDTECLVKKLDMVPVECVVRNRAAGSLVKRLGIEEGIELKPAAVRSVPEKRRHARSDGQRILLRNLWLGEQREPGAYERADLQSERRAEKLFDDAGLILVDFKLEFGLYKGEVVLGDEFSPDGSRLWDKETLEKMDKDRFRQSSVADRGL